MCRAMVFAALLAFTGCGKKDDNKAAGDNPKPTTDPGKPTEPGITAPTPGATPSGTTPTPAPSGAPKVIALGCDKLVPQALRDKHFKGATFTDSTQANLQSGACDIEAPVTPEMKVAPSEKTWKGEISATCHEGMPAGVMDSMLKRETTNIPDQKPLTIGKGGATMPSGNNGSRMNAFVYDNDADCKVETHLPKEIHNEAILQDLIAGLPVK